MSTETTAPATTPEVPANLRQARKEQAAAKKPAATKPAAKKTPAAKAAPKAKVEKAAVEKKTYTATGRSGQAVYRQFAATMTHAVDVADPKSQKPLPRAGQIWGFYSSAEKAEAAAGKLRAKGFDVVVTADVTIASKPVAA